MPQSEDDSQELVGPAPISFKVFRPPHTGPVSLASPQTFNTANSSIASYSTAPSGSRSYMQHLPAYNRSGRVLQHDTKTRLADEPGLQEAMKNIFLRISNVKDVLDPFHDRDLESCFRLWIRGTLTSSQRQGNSADLLDASRIKDMTDEILDFNIGIGKGMRIIDLTDLNKQENLRGDLATLIQQFLSLRKRQAEFKAATVFSSEWLIHLQSRGILLDPKDELDWSGRGQHVEYKPNEQDNIPLISERILGHSGSAIVDSVKCRRIRLARKKITCHRQLKKEIAISEVQQLQLLPHSHIVRVVGTYTAGRFLAILLYPATQWNLDEFMDELQSEDSKVNFGTSIRSEQVGNHAMGRFFGCLSNAINFIHEHNVKHMDIKPKNLLVRPDGKGTYKIYIADFGIARAYKSANEICTDSPISFTRAYAAPEVVAQEKRGSSADIFSLGCVFMEMMATMLSSPTDDHRLKLQELRQSNLVDSSFQANIKRVQQWCFEVPETLFKSGKGLTELPVAFVERVSNMIEEAPEKRLAAWELKSATAKLHCSTCNDGPEPFEAAGPWEL